MYITGLSLVSRRDCRPLYMGTLHSGTNVRPALADFDRPARQAQLKSRALDLVELAKSRSLATLLDDVRGALLLRQLCMNGGGGK